MNEDAEKARAAALALMGLKDLYLCMGTWGSRFFEAPQLEDLRDKFREAVAAKQVADIVDRAKELAMTHVPDLPMSIFETDAALFIDIGRPLSEERQDVLRRACQVIPPYIMRAMVAYRAAREAKPSKQVSEDSGSLNVKPAEMAAYQQHDRAIRESGEQALTLRQAYDWLDLHGEEMPVFDTWRVYVSRVRKAVSGFQNSPRAGRSGRSIKRPDEM